MADVENVNAGQFGARKSTTRMTAAELAPFAEDRLSDEYQRRRVEDYAGRMQRRGYRAGDADKPIILVHNDSESFLWNGNHRVAAAGLAGYDKKMPLEVWDYRTGS